MSTQFSGTEDLSEDEKQAILGRFGYLVKAPDASADDQLAQVREGLEEQIGRPVQLGEPLVRGAWDPNASQWDRFTYWAARFYQRADFQEREIDWKIQIATRMGEAREALLENRDEWIALLRRAFGTRDQLTGWRVFSEFLTWCAAEPDIASDVLKELWDIEQPLEERLSRFFQHLPREAVAGPSGRLGIASQLLLGEDVYSYPFYKATPIAKYYEMTGIESPGDVDVVERYLHAIKLMDMILSEGERRSVEFSHRLNAQSLAWSIWSWSPEVWSAREQEELQRFRDGLLPCTCPDNGGPLSALANKLLIDVSALEDMRDLLEHRRQAIFFGPPGTGKTYVALQLAEFLAGSKERVKLVQFHAAYAYEDFVEGFRPREVNGAPGFQLEDGPLKRIAEQARSDSGQMHVLVIDEINRANIARVFGELYFLLEYRDAAIDLQYSSNAFSLPKNLLIIGTMNTADRSIALLDAALRRRFYFIPFFPMEPPIEGLLHRWLQRHAREMAWVADVVDQANHLLDDRDGGIGPSYFMSHGGDLNERWVELIWAHQIMPYLEEHFFGARDRLDDFQLDRLREPSGISQPAVTGETDADPTETE